MKTVSIVVAVAASFITYASAHPQGGTIPTPSTIFAPVVISQSTPVPTVTTTPTPPPTSTPEPTATPAPNAETVTVLGNHSVQVDDSFVYIYGEIRNDTKGKVWLVELTVDLFDQAGNLVDTTRTYAHPSITPPGAKACFVALFANTPDEWQTYTISSSYRKTDMQLAGLTIVNSASVNAGTEYRIIGQVRNDSNDAINYPAIVATMYGSNGNVAGCSLTFAGNVIQPGATNSFKISHWDQPELIASYRLATD